MPSKQPIAPAPFVVPGPGTDTNAPPDPGFAKWLEQRQKAGGTTGTGAATDPWRSQAGHDLVVRTNIDPTVTSGTMQIADVMWRFYQWDEKRVAALAAKLQKAGFLPTANATRDSVWDAYRRVLMEAGQRYNADPTKAPTVEQILNKYTKAPVGDATGEKPKPASYTQTSEQLTDPGSANELLTKTLTDALGRAPTDSEKHGFLAALNAAQRANPQKTLYTLNPETDGYDANSTSGGVNPTAFASEYVEDNTAMKKEMGAYQMATTYMGALEQALGAIGG